MASLSCVLCENLSFYLGCLFWNGSISLDARMGGKDKQRTKGNVKVW